MKHLDIVVKNELVMKAEIKMLLLFLVSKIDKSNLDFPITVVLPFSEIESKAGKMKINWVGVDNFTHQLARTELSFNTKAPLCSCIIFKKIITFYENDIGYCKVVFSDEFIKRF